MKVVSTQVHSLICISTFPTYWLINSIFLDSMCVSCSTLCNSMDCSLPGFSVRGISQVRILEWVAISFSNAWRWKVKVKSLSPVRLWATPWTAAYQAPPSMGFSGQQYWSGVPLPSPIKYYSAIKKKKKKLLWVSSGEVTEPGACYIEWSKSEREKHISRINVYVWNLGLSRWLW